MLNKKQLFGLTLMLALLSPVCVNAMDAGAAGDAAAGARKKAKTGGAASATATMHDHDDDGSGEDAATGAGAAGAGAGAGAGKKRAAAGAKGAKRDGAGVAGLDADVDDLVDDVIDDATDATGLPKPSADVLGAVHGVLNNWINLPLNTALTKMSAMGIKTKTVMTALLIYIGWSASGQIVTDVTTNIPNAVKSLVGIDCEDSSCRGDNWTEAA